MSMFFCLLLTLGALISAWQLIIQSVRAGYSPYLLGREANTVHLIMNLGMALMLAPFFKPGWHLGIVTAYALTTAVLSIKAGVKSTQKLENGGGLGESIYHIFAMLAMIYASLHMTDSTTLVNGATEHSLHSLAMFNHQLL